MSLAKPSDVDGLFRLDGRVAIVTGGTGESDGRLQKGSATGSSCGDRQSEARGVCRDRKGAP